MGEICRCDQCGKPYRESWSDPGVCISCAVNNLRRALLEAIEPVVVPILEWINEKLADRLKTSERNDG